MQYKAKPIIMIISQLYIMPVKLC